MAKKQKEAVEEEVSREEKIEALHNYQRGEGEALTDFDKNSAIVDSRYAQLMGLPTPEE